MIVRCGALAGALVLLGGCSWAGGDGHDRNPENRPRYVTQPDADDHRLRGGADARRFSLVNGADVVRVRVADLGADRYDVSTPDGSKVVPTVAVDDGEIIAGVRDSGGTGPAVVNVVLDDNVRWQIRLAGGASDQAVDLTAGPGGDVDFSAGTARAAVALPAARGTQRVVLAGGAGEFRVRLAGRAPVRVRAGGGAGSVTIDGERHSGVAGGTVWAPDDWSSAADRYDIDATSGFSTLDVSRA
nr:hypothetical protein [uncultured Actinoplanes sp.]